MDEINIWICPATIPNLDKTIHNTHNDEYCWALNATSKGRNLFNKLKIGDKCIFGNLKEGIGFTRIGIVKNKRLMTELEINLWPIPSPSNTHWKYIFELDNIKICNITPYIARQLRGWNSTKQTWRTQTLLKGGKENFYNYIITNNLL